MKCSRDHATFYHLFWSSRDRVLKNLQHFRAAEQSDGTATNEEVNAENGDDENDDDDDDESVDGEADDDVFNVNYGVVTAIRALAVKGTTLKLGRRIY